MEMINNALNILKKIFEDKDWYIVFFTLVSWVVVSIVIIYTLIQFILFILRVRYNNEEFISEVNKVKDQSNK